MRYLITILLLLVGMLRLSGAPSGDRLNVLFIATDDLRTNLGCYGDPVAKTPNLDSLAKRGVRFDRAYCQQALCNPSRSSLLTGLRPDTIKVWNLPTHFRDNVPDVVTLPQHFKNNGYFAQDIGKIFHNWRTEVQGDPDSWSVPAVMHFATHNSDVAIFEGGEVPRSFTETKGTEAREVPDEAYFDGRVAAKAIEALRSMSQKNKPFFLGVGFWKPHLPFNPPKRYWDMYRRDEIPPIKNPAFPVGAPTLAAHDANEGMAETVTDLENQLVLRHGYYAATSFVDAQIGKVVAELDRLGLAENTIIVLWSDHGFHLGENGLWGKTSNYELDARVPLIIAAPGYVQNRTSSGLVELLDLYPTLVEMCGLPAVDGLEGESIKHLLADPRARGKSAAFTQHPRPAHMKDFGEVMGYSMRTDQYRYTEWRDWQSGDVLGLELYDHETDGDETQNLAGHLDLIPTQRRLAHQMGEQFPRRGLPIK